MAGIEITPEMLDGKANELKKLRENHDSNMRTITSLVNGLNEIWKGEAQQGFVNKFDSMQNTFKEFSEVLEGYAKLMEMTSQSFREMDGQLKTKMNQSFGG